MKYLKILYRLLVFTLLVFSVFSGDIKKKKDLRKKSSENEQSTGHFQSFFSRPLDPKSEKKIPVNQLIKKFWPKIMSKSMTARGVASFPYVSI